MNIDPKATELNALIARLSYMVNGQIGRDWRTGRPFVVNGDEFHAIKDALSMLQRLRVYLAAAPAEGQGWRTDIDNAPRVGRSLFALDWADDCKHLHPPLRESQWRDDAVYFGYFQGWASIYKPVGWLPLPPIEPGEQ